MMINQIYSTEQNTIALETKTMNLRNVCELTPGEKGRRYPALEDARSVWDGLMLVLTEALASS